MRKAAGLDAVRAQRARTVALADGLAAEDWELPCLPPWAVRDVLAHLVASDRASITGAIVRPLLGSSDRSVVERWNDQAVRRWRDRPPQEIVDGLRRWGARVERLGRAVPGPVARLPVGTPYGRHPVVFLLYLRVWDEWVHEQDVRWALGAAPGAVPGAVRDDVPSPPPLVIGQALADMTLAVLPRRRLPVVARRAGIARLVVDPAPPGGAVTARPVTWGVDFARRQYGPRVTSRPDAEIRVHAAALALLLGDRLDWRVLGAPWLSVDGDAELAAELLDAVPLPSSGPV